MSAANDVIGVALFPKRVPSVLFADATHPLGVRAHAMDQVHAIAERQGVDVGELFRRCKPLYAKVWAGLNAMGMDCDTFHHRKEKEWIRNLSG